MSVYAERRTIMDRNFVPPVSIEKFAAYLDGNLSEEEMDGIDALVSSNPVMEELVSISDEIDEDVQVYLQDEFAYEADMTTLEDSDFDIPNLDADILPQTETDDLEQRGVACAADEVTDIEELGSLDDDDETAEDVSEGDEFRTHQGGDSISEFNENNGGNAHEPSGFPLDEVFLSD